MKQKMKTVPFTVTETKDTMPLHYSSRKTAGLERYWVNHSKFMSFGSFFIFLFLSDTFLAVYSAAKKQSSYVKCLKIGKSVTVF